MLKAVWRDTTLAESEHTILLEGNQYFPPASLKREYLKESDSHTVCPWKGTASYYDIVVEGQRLKDGAWYYPEPKKEAGQIKDHVAFWKGVIVEH